MKLLHLIASSSLSVILLTFPDPPFPSNAEYRFNRASTTTELHRILWEVVDSTWLQITKGTVSWGQTIMDEKCKGLFTPIASIPDRSNWLPVISKYEQKGSNEGRMTCLASWEVIGKC